MALTQISTAGVKDDAVTSGKIPANAVGSSELADNAVDTAAIADDAVTDAKLANSINSAIAANTAKTSNATHTGDVTGSTSLTITSGAVTTAKIADSAITGAKMGNGSVGTTQLVDGLITGAKMGNGSVGTNQLVDQAVTLAKLPHGTSSQDGKFLRANNGADPTFETVSIPAGTTINNNANNRVITGSGTANTLEGESNLTFSSNTLDVNNAVKLPDAGTVHFGASDTAYVRGKDSTDGYIKLGTNGTDRITVDNNGFVGIGETAPLAPLHIKPASNVKQLLLEQNNATDGYALFVDGPNGGHLKFMRHINGSDTQKALLRSDGGLCFGTDSATANALDDYEVGTWTPNVAGNNSGTYSNRNGDYVKIGSFVHCNFYISVSNVSYGISYFAMAGLPFTPAGDGAGSFMAKYHSTNNNRWFVLHTSSGSNTLYAYGTENGQTWEALAADSTFEMIGTFTYKTNS